MGSSLCSINRPSLLNRRWKTVESCVTSTNHAVWPDWSVNGRISVRKSSLKLVRMYSLMPSGTTVWFSEWGSMRRCFAAKQTPSALKKADRGHAQNHSLSPCSFLVCSESKSNHQGSAQYPISLLMAIAPRICYLVVVGNHIMQVCYKNKAQNCRKPSWIFANQYRSQWKTLGCRHKSV